MPSSGSAQAICDVKDRRFQAPPVFVCTEGLVISCAEALDGLCLPKTSSGLLSLDL